MTDDDVTLTQFCIPQPDQLDNPVGPTLSKHNFSSVDVGHPKARSFIYEASPTKIATYFGALDRANSGPDEKCRLPCPPEHCVPPANCGDAGGADSDDDELDLKISFMKFKAGSIALFVPVDATRKVWMAFHSNKPYHFLAQVIKFINGNIIFFKIELLCRSP